MKKRLGLVLVMIFVLMITGCGNSNNTEEANVADNQIMENADQTNIEENTLTVSVPEELGTVRNVTDENMSTFTGETADNSLIAIAEEPNVADNQIIKNADQTYAEENISTENALKELEIVSNEVDVNIINVNEINAQGGNIEFADTMTYKEFLALQWTNDVDNSLANDTLIYVVKIYYPNGFEHYKVGTINNCETIGIYRADNGEYLGGSFRERLE